MTSASNRKSIIDRLKTIRWKLTFLAFALFALLLDGSGLHARSLALLQREGPGSRVSLGVAFAPSALCVAARIFGQRKCFVSLRSIGTPIINKPNYTQIMTDNYFRCWVWA